MALISFTRKHADRSSSTGFQFEFFCDVCSSGHMTAFQYDSVGVASTLLSAAEILLRRGSRFGAAGEQVNRLLRGKAWDEAYTHAVEEAKQTFKHCTRCSSWVCADNCWTAEHNQCRKCTPDLAVEAPSMQAQAGKWQVFGKALQSDQTGGRDMSQPQLADCPHCGARTKFGGEFCTNCGKVIIADVHCKKCESKWPSHENYQFCPGCGATFSDETPSEPEVQHEPEPEPVAAHEPEHKVEPEREIDREPELEPDSEPEVKHECESEVEPQVKLEVRRGPDSVQVAIDAMAPFVVSQDEMPKEPKIAKAKPKTPKAQPKLTAVAKPKKKTTVVAKSKTKASKPAKAKATAKAKTKAPASKAVREKTTVPKTVSKAQAVAAKPKAATKSKAATKAKAVKPKAKPKTKVAKPKAKVAKPKAKVAKPNVKVAKPKAKAVKPKTMVAKPKAKVAKPKAKTVTKARSTTKAKPVKTKLTKPKPKKQTKTPKKKAKTKSKRR